MGGTCSASRQRAIWQNNDSDNGRGSDSSDSASVNRHGRRYRLVRHSVESEVPDGSISALYPTYDNYIIVPNNRRSPKSLVELCIEAVCRSLPDLDGELPPGLPQDLVDAIVKSLMSHAALNSTTLRVLRNCEIGELSLAGCRGVRDEWFKPLSSRSMRSAISSLPPPPGPTSFCGSLTSGYDGMSPCTSPVVNPCTMTPSRAKMVVNCGPHASSSSPDHHVDMMEIENLENLTMPSVTRDRCIEDSHVGFGSSSEDEKKMSPQDYKNIMLRPLQGGDSVASSSSSSSSGTTFVSASSTPFVAHMEEESCADADFDSYDVNTSHAASGGDAVRAYKCERSFPPPQSIPEPPSITSNLTLLDLRGSQRLTDRGLLQLSNLRNLEVAKLDHCHSIVGRGLIAFAHSFRLHTLTLANCRRLTDEAIVNIGHLTNLTSLSVDGCRCLTDASLVAVGNLYSLQNLDLSQCDLISDEGITNLHSLPYLTELSLGWCRNITDVGIEILCHQPGRERCLKVLRLARCPITDKGVGELECLRGLEELDLNGCSSVGSAALGGALECLGNLMSLDVSYCPGILRLSWQGKIPSLKSLELCYSGVRDNHLSRLTHLPNLTELNLDSCPVGDWAIAHLADNGVVPNLTTLDLADTDVTDLGMVHLPKFTKLVKLSLFYCNISNAGLRHLRNMTTLEALNLDSRDIGDEGLMHLRNLTRLKSLDIFSGRITDMGCIHIARISSLTSLELCGGGIGDRGCAHLAILENLTSLNLSQNERITNRGAAALATLTHLKGLNLSNTRVNVDALRLLGGLTKLQSLAMYGCMGVDDTESISTLQNGLPSLKCLRLNNWNDDCDGWDDHDDAAEEEPSEDEEEDDVVVRGGHHLREVIGDGSVGSSGDDEESTVHNEDFYDQVVHEESNADSDDENTQLGNQMDSGVEEGGSYGDGNQMDSGLEEEDEFLEHEDFHEFDNEQYL
eukprot:CAMPEP_0195512656 /NCGR_PEP_ID=MMETSP0794_2-20130614/4542_1 /TAXON_ID=515487 /ORGANISM="Stephanopyxis turris, Strain CCMP 815" /LENGTH=963 /DNA_ID=CAMNT_0040640493 /DNA_START=271 /DNA_END=3162 /DNA_ORIENTATION=+